MQGCICGSLDAPTPAVYVGSSFVAVPIPIPVPKMNPVQHGPIDEQADQCNRAQADHELAIRDTRN